MITRGAVTWVSTESDTGKTVVVLEDETTRQERAIGVWKNLLPSGNIKVFIANSSSAHFLLYQLSQLL